jgi:general bacterial porin, GBP family
MKKSLIALAVLSTIAGSAAAQSSVTVYGNVDMNFGSSEDATGRLNSGMGESGLSTSRIGFKGVEDLGGGLKAEFQLESRLDATTGKLGSNTSTSTFTGTSSTAVGTVTGTNAYTPAGTVATTTTNTVFNREAWVGLSSAKLGSIRLGTTDITGAQGLDSTVGQAGNFSDAASNLGTDVAKTVRYTTPTFAGLSAQVGYSNADSTQTAEVQNNRLTSAYVQYEAGNFGVYAGKVEKQISATYDQKETTYGAKYNFGFAAVGAYRSVRDAATEADVSSKGDFTQTIFSVSAPVAVLGAGVTAHGVYYKNEYDVANLTGDVDGYKLALSKAFSKRTTGYIAHVNQSTNNTTDKDAKTFLVGVNHAF